MVDWLAVWGVYTVAGFVFKDVLAPLAKGALEDYVKDFFKDSIKDFTGLFERDTLQKVVGKALKEFLQLVQQELEDADLSEAEMQLYAKPLKQFISNQSVKEILGSAFKEDCQRIDTGTLAKTWNDLNLRSLPDEFDWEQVAKRYLKKAKAIIRESDELRSLLDSQNLAAAQESLKNIAGIPTDFNLITYQEGIREQYGNLKLESLDTSGYAYNELKLWRMFIAQNVREVHQVLPQIHEVPKEHQRRLRESNQLEPEISPEEWERYKQVYLQQPTRSVLDIVNENQTYKYLVILGDPGSGKSTLLQYIALQWAELPTKDLPLKPIPLLIELRAYMRNRDSNQCQDFLEFLHKGIGIICHLNQHQLHDRLKAGNAIVMFDGLDEVFDPGKREDVTTDIIRFTNDYPNVRVIVTSRVIGYKPQKLRDAEFRHFILQDLEPEQIREFINRWHDLTFNDEVDKVRKRDRLQLAIDTSSAIRELAGNPLLLTMMAILNRNQQLPRDRPELYNQASRVLLHQWDVEQKLLTVPDIDPYTIDLKDKQAILRQIAYSMQAVEKGLAGNLISTTDLERILIDYLKERVDKPIKVARLMIEQLRTRNFILCFLGADYYAFVHRTFLEYFCAWEFVRQFEKERKISLEELKTEVFGKHWQDESWHEVLRLITGMIDAKFAGETIDCLIEQNGEKEKFINLFLAAKCLLEVRNRHAIAPIDAKLLTHLQDLTKYDLNTYEEKVAIHMLAVAAVATTWKDYPNILEWLETCAQSNNSFVGYMAVRQLAGWKDFDSLPWLKTHAQSNKDWLVRSAAVQGLAECWRDDPDTLPILKTCAEFDREWMVRYAAMLELAEGWRDKPGMFEFLYNLAVNDPFKRREDWQANPRQTALEAIIEHYPNHPQTLLLLRDRAENDPDKQVRGFAKQKLQEWEVRK